MKVRNAALVALLTTTLFAGYFALAWQRRLDVSEADAYGGALRSLLALDFRLAGEVMKARVGLVGHYDGLVQTDLELRVVHARLQRMPSYLSTAQREQLARQLATSAKLHGQVRTAIERWKSANAVLRNSLRFLPQAALSLDGHAGNAADARALRADIDTLVRDVLVLQSMEDPAVLRRISDELARLNDPGLLASQPTLQDDIRVVLKHARVGYERTPVVNELTRSIMNVPLSATTESLTSSYARYQRAAISRRNLDASVLFLLALAAVLSSALAIILRLRHSASALRKTSAQLEAALASLRSEQAKERELSDLKTKFVSMTSHEFRTPLTTIMSSSELLSVYGSKWPAEKIALHFERIKGAALGMTRLLDAILLIGRSDAGMLTFSPQPLDLGRLCSETVDAASGGSPRREIVLEGATAGEIVLADETLLRHILQNLLSNAIKYSPADSQVHVTVARDAQDMLFEVRDHGLGIPEPDQKRLFETFHRGGNVGHIAGSGLGLAIVKRAIELHGGALQLDSQVGVGSRFVARVPCPKSPGSVT